MNPLQEKALRVIGPFASAYGFYLAGGTALALQLHHRRSRDFDFFSPVKFDDTTKFVHTIKSAGIDFKVQQIAKGTVFGIANGVEVSFIEYLYPVLNSIVCDSNYSIEMVDTFDIAAMKASALVQRGMKRDFIDLYALMKSGISIQQMLDAYKMKYGVDNTLSIIRSLTYFDDAETANMPEMIWPLKWIGVKKTISKAVTEFTNNRSRT